MATTQAEARQLTRDELLYQINNLLAQIASLQAIIDEREKGVSIQGEPTIVLTSPNPFFAVKDGDSYEVSWDAKHVPASSMLLIETKSLMLYGGSGVGGGSARLVMQPGDSQGIRTYKTGVGYSDPGTYEVRAQVVACADVACTQPVVTYDSRTGAKIYLTEIYAESDWVRYSITEDEQLGFVGDGTITIGYITPSEGQFRLEEEMTIAYYLFGDIKEDQEACFYLRSSTGGSFSPNSNTYQACAPAKVGYNERVWTPYRTSGFALNPGLYQFKVVVNNFSNGTGKDAGYAAEKNSGWIELLPESE